MLLREVYRNRFAVQGVQPVSMIRSNAVVDRRHWLDIFISS
jgi:hypothetical protein